MGRAELVVPVRGHDQHGDPVQATSQKTEHIQTGLIRPVHVLQRQQGRRPSQFSKQRRRNLMGPGPTQQESLQSAARLLHDIQERPERPGREQRITPTQQDPKGSLAARDEPAQQSALTHARLPRDEHQLATGQLQDAVQRAIERRLLVRSFNKMITTRQRGPPRSPQQVVMHTLDRLGLSPPGPTRLSAGASRVGHRTRVLASARWSRLATECDHRAHVPNEDPYRGTHPSGICDDNNRVRTGNCIGAPHVAMAAPNGSGRLGQSAATGTTARRTRSHPQPPR